MDISEALAAQLAALDPAVALPGMVEALNDALLAAVPSGLGLAMTIRTGSTDVTLSTLERKLPPASSLRVPLAAWADVERGSAVVFYAGTAGALVDLAADLGWALHLGLAWTDQPGDDVLVLDQHLTPDPDARPLSGLDELSAVHQAFGVLLAEGSMPEAVALELRAVAETAQLSVPAAAEQMISDLVHPAVAASPDLAAFRAGVAWVGAAEAGDHLCGLYRGQEQRDALLLPYLRAGLRGGDKCLCFVDQTEPTTLVDRLSNGIDAHAMVDTGQLEIDKATDVYLRSGGFSTDDMIGFLTDAMSAVETADSYRQFRAAGEMSWIHRHLAGTDEFFGYESAVNQVAAEHPAVLLCLYDLDDLDDAMLLNVLKTHPTVLYDQHVTPNSYYLTPDEYATQV